MNKIKEKIPMTEIMAGLAEEASELAQAALKLRRVWDKTNPTPTPEDYALSSLYEEIADVQLYISLRDLNHSAITSMMHEKMERWLKRLEEKK